LCVAVSVSMCMSLSVCVCVSLSKNKYIKPTHWKDTEAHLKDFPVVKFGIIQQ